MTVVKLRSIFTDLKSELLHFSKSTLHQNRSPTSQGFEPHIRLTFFKCLHHDAFCDGLDGAPMIEHSIEDLQFILDGVYNFSRNLR